MNKYKNIICLFILLLLLNGCDFSPFYKVGPDEQAIVTKNGDIVGAPKGPGLHFKLPYFHKVNLVNVYMIRAYPLPIPKSETIEAKIFWKVNDSITYFKESQKKDSTDWVPALIAPVFQQIITEYDIGSIEKIYEGQDTSSELARNAREKIKIQIQRSVEGFGIEFIDTRFEKKNKSITSVFTRRGEAASE